MFNKGDRVKCVNDSSCNTLTYGHIYTVERYIKDSDLLTLKEVGNVYGLFSFKANRFIGHEIKHQLSTPMTNTSKVFMVYNTTNKGTPRVTHNTFEDAKNEANRLATANPNCEFLVMEASYAVKRVPQYITEERSFNISH